MGLRNFLQEEDGLRWPRAIPSPSLDALLELKHSSHSKVAGIDALDETALPHDAEEVAHLVKFCRIFPIATLYVYLKRT